MFVLKSKYEELGRALVKMVGEHRALLARWNEMVDLITAKGGMEFLERGRLGPDQLDAEDIKRLLQLCHPDKHDGKPMAHDMTAKLLKIREQLQ